MKRYTKRVVICYDMDEAGRAAADKAVRLLEEVGLEVRLLKMEGAKDPDEFIQKFGSEQFKRVLEASNSKFEYNLGRILSKYVLTIPQDKIDAAKEITTLISQVQLAAERDVYIHTMAERLGISAQSLKQDVDRLVAKGQREAKKKETTAARQVSLGFTDRVNPDFVKMPGVANCEETVLGILLIRPEYCKLIEEGSVPLSGSHFLTAFNHRVFEAIMASEDHVVDQELFDPDEFSRIVRMKVRRMELTDNGQEVFIECVRNLVEMADKERQKSAGGMDALLALIQQKQNESN